MTSLFSPAAVGFAARTTGSALLALWAAYSLQIESPAWAATTCIVLASPYHGQVISKGMYRFIGTVAGAAMAIFLVGGCAQTPELFVLLLSVWIGACMFAATLLRNFVAYAAMLAGFTTAVIALGAVPANPLHVLEVAAARVAAIFLGIVTSALVASIFSPHGATRQMNEHLDKLMLEIAKLLQTFADTDLIVKMRHQRRPLGGEIIALDSHITFAASETDRARQESEGLLGIGVALLHALTAMGGTGFAQLRMTQSELNNDRLRTALQSAVEAGRQLEIYLKTGSETDLKPIRARLRKLTANSLDTEAGAASPIPVAIDRIRETLDHLAAAIAGYHEWKTGMPVISPPRGRFDFHTDRTDAVLNGLRCGLLTLAAGAFWIITAWPSGGFLTILTAVYGCVISVQKNPLTYGPPFFTGVLVAIPVSGLVMFGPLCWIEGFVPLAFVLGVPLFAGALAWGSELPRLSPAGLAFLLMVMLIIAPSNPMVFDFTNFINMVLATIVGLSLSVASSIFVLPLDPVSRSRRLIRTGCCEVEQLAGAATYDVVPTRAAWESRMYDRLCGSMPYLIQHVQDKEEAEILDSAFAALQIGATVVEIREALTIMGSPELRNRILPVLDRLMAMGNEPELIAASMQATATRLAATDPECCTDILLRKSVAISLEEIAVLLHSYGAVYRRVRYHEGEFSADLLQPGFTA
ncbi:MAG: FUSC family protein [Candidatus Methylacidiphilales bacterium]